MQRLTYRNFGDHQMLLLNHTVAADGDPRRITQVSAGTSCAWEHRRVHGKFISRELTRPMPMTVGLGVSRWTGWKHRARFPRFGRNMFPSLHYAGRRPTDPPGTLPLGELTLMDGSGSPVNTSFFGDYSQMTIDPSDDCTFWYTGTYYPRLATDHWHTRIGCVQIHELPRQGPRAVRRNSKEAIPFRRTLAPSTPLRGEATLLTQLIRCKF